MRAEPQSLTRQPCTYSAPSFLTGLVLQHGPRSSAGVINTRLNFFGQTISTTNETAYLGLDIGQQILMSVGRRLDVEGDDGDWVLFLARTDGSKSTYIDVLARAKAYRSAFKRYGPGGSQEGMRLMHEAIFMEIVELAEEIEQQQQLSEALRRASNPSKITKAGF